MKKKRHRPRPTRPRDQFAEVIDRCERVRKILRRLKRRLKGGNSLGNERNALLTAELMLRLAKYGKRQRAAEAIEVAERLDILSQLLVGQLDVLLVSLGQVRE